MVKKGDVSQSKFLKVVEELKKGEKKRRKLEEKAKAAMEDEASLENEIARAKIENTELQAQLQGTQDDLQTVQRNYATLSGKVMGLEKQIKEAE